MATDLHIHISDGLTQADYQCVFSSHHGSAYYQETYYRCPEKPPAKQGGQCAHWERVWSMPDILVAGPWPHPSQHIPEVELAQLPDPYGEVMDIFPEDGMLPIQLTAERIEQVGKALQIPAELLKQYPGYEAQGREQEILDFLKSHQGKGVFLLHH